MANNRLWLVHRPTGEAVYLGKRMAVGWYDVQNTLLERMRELFHRIELNGFEGQDDFVLVLEDASLAPSCTDQFVYDKTTHKPKLK